MLASSSKNRLLLAAACLAAAAAHAEPTQVKPGLWAQAVSTTVNGKPLKMPNMGDGPAAQEWKRIQQAMKQFGLPEGWQPGLSCQRESSVDARDLIAKDKMASGCKFDVLEQRRDGGRFSMRCQLPEGVSQGSGEVTVTNGTEARFDSRSRMETGGQAVSLETKVVSKWVGPDCAHPPAGIDPSWVQQD
jgi:hypothetical protein